MDLLIVSDPQQFMTLVMHENQKDRINGLKTLDDIVLCDILRYGIQNDAGMIADLKQLYGEWLKQVPADRRGEVFRHVQGMVENVDYECVFALRRGRRRQRHCKPSSIM